MRVKINNKIKNFRTVWFEDNKLKLINQPKLPHSFEIFESADYRRTAQAIRDMIVRGAPAIGATACYAMAQAVLSGEKLKKAEEVISNTRPTAYDLFDAIEFFKNAKGNPIEIAEKYAQKSIERCKKIGNYGEKLIKDGMKILTHCNAGALGCVDYGTALAPIRFAHYNNKKIFVFVDETRPRCQGSRLTAWELVQEDIEHAIIADNAAGYFMQNAVNLIIVGADRIALNGDVANKIGTYEKAVVAKENNIPFYVAAPLSTVDANCKTGKEIPIEERSQEEVKGFLGKVEIAPRDSTARNPAFDVTPAKYITGIITEFGIVKAHELKKLLNVKV